MNFTKLDDTDYPYIDNVDVYALKNDYDYKRFDNAQMTIHILNVPWDMGEAHVGQRTITGIGNVVKFESDEARDVWFSSKRYAETPEQWASGGYDGFKWSTKYRQFHNGDDLKIPLPFDVVARFNYAFITYEPAPTAENPVDYEAHGLLKWFLFIRNFQMSSVNTTSCVVKRDTWTTYINHIRFKGMMFEQGHYPVAMSNVDSYLANPINNNSGLLDEDVVFGELSKVSHSSAVVLNDTDIKAVIVTSSNPQGSWGSKSANNWKTPNGYKMQDGQPSFWAFCMDASNLPSFISAMNSSIPQFAQTIKAVFFVAQKLITIGDAFEFCGIACNKLGQRNAQFDLLKLAKEQFAYDKKYSHLAKLYTYPYAALEVTDEKGNVSLIRIEDTSGNITLRTSMNVAFPWINIDARLDGIGGNVTNTLAFKNVNSHSFSFSGKWYEHLIQWQIPTFAITQTASVVNDYATHFDRLQQKNNADVAQTNTLASNATNKTNADNSAATAKTNTDAQADMSVTNTEVQNAANTANVDLTNTNLNLSTTIENNYTYDSMMLNNSVTAETTNNEVDAAYASAAITGVGGVLSGAVQGAASGAALGPAGIAAGAAGGLIGGAIGGITTQMQTSVSNNLLESQADAQKTANYSHYDLIAGAGDPMSGHGATNNARLGLQKALNSGSTRINNENNTTQTANNAGLMKANASRDKSTANANAANTKSTSDANANRDYNNALAAIQNQINQAALDAPSEFGEFFNGDTATSRPMAMVANVVTQNKDAIEKTGDQFLRFGYAYHKYIEFQDFNLMPKFTYWKCSDVWVYGLDMADEHMDEIRFFLMGGVTVWRAPELIGTTSIYENV